MLKITPKAVNTNILPLGQLLTWPDTLPINTYLTNVSGQVIPTIESAVVLVEDDVDAAAIESELSEKQGMVPVNVHGFPPEENIFVYSIVNVPDGKLFMCIGTDKINHEDTLEFTRQIWPLEDPA